jgi:hypothetical protein
MNENDGLAMLRPRGGGVLYLRSARQNRAVPQHPRPGAPSRFPPLVWR